MTSDLDKSRHVSEPAVPQHVIDAFERRYQDQYDLSLDDHEWRNTWRYKHDHVQSFWAGWRDCYIAALPSPAPSDQPAEKPAVHGPGCNSHQDLPCDCWSLYAAPTQQEEATGLEVVIREILDEDAPNKFVWKTHETQDEWIRLKLLPCIRAADARITALQAEVERLREALTPSGDTKAAYMGEFTIAIERHVNEDEEPEDETEGATDPYERITVPWTTIKEIMAAIRARAATALGMIDKGVARVCWERVK